MDSNKFNLFKLWLKSNTSFSERTISDTASRARRALSMIGGANIERDDLVSALVNSREFSSLSMSVKSQLKKAISLFEASTK